MSKENKPITELDYEAGMKELETITNKLETSQLPLDEMMGLYARGQELAKHCTMLLEQAELQITNLDEYEDTDEEEA